MELQICYTKICDRCGQGVREVNSVRYWNAIYDAMRNFRDPEFAVNEVQEFLRANTVPFTSMIVNGINLIDCDRHIMPEVDGRGEVVCHGSLEINNMMEEDFRAKEAWELLADYDEHD